jgi:2-hydroxychromene-2-carboxylate isomerase
MTAKHVDYYLSLNSPWAYLGSKRFEVIAKKYNADVTIWPVDFGSVFAVSGGLPLPKRAPQRQAYRMMELKRWRDHLGVKVTLEPKFFPSNELPAAQCVIALREQGRMADAIKVAHAVLAGLWAEEKNPGDPATLKTIIASCGLDADSTMKAGEAPEMTAKREAYTKHAIDQGVFGAPFFVIDGEKFWGQDRLDFVDRKLAS